METTHTQITPTPTRQEVQNTLPSLSTQILTNYPPVISNDHQQNFRSLIGFLFNSDDELVIHRFSIAYPGYLGKGLGKIICNLKKQSPDELRARLQPKWDHAKLMIDRTHKMIQGSLG